MINARNDARVAPQPDCLPGRRVCGGFTLLEMMLTVGLIALTATFVGLNVGRSDTRLAELEARRFVALLNMAQDESIVSGRPIILTMDVGTHSYQFAPMDVPAVFQPGSSDEQELDQELEQNQQVSLEPGGYSTQADSFFKQRFIPERVAIEFSRLPDLPDANADDGFVPKRVHEILNQSLFDDDEEMNEDEGSRALVLIEPNGLVSPFSLSLSIEGRVSSVVLDRFGRAALQEQQ